MWKWFIFSVWYNKNISLLHFCFIIDELMSVLQNMWFSTNITT
jgi:hypothetical protein